MIRFIVLLLVIFISTVFANNQQTKEIAILSASTIYDFDNKRLPTILDAYLKNNESIKALIISDKISNKTVLSFYRDKGIFIFQEKIPSKLTKLNKYESNILYDGEIIGIVSIFTKDTKKTIFYTKEEKEWLENNPISRVAVMNYWPQDDKGNSLHTEVLKLINKYSGTNLIPIKFNAWSDGYTKAEKGESLSAIMGLSWSEERRGNSFFYTPAYDFTPVYLITKKNNNTIHSLSDLKNKTVYLKENSITSKIMKEQVPSAKILSQRTIQDMYKSFSNDKKADAILSYFIDESELGKYNLKLANTIDNRYGEVSLGINHRYPHLATIINKAFAIIPKVEISALRERKWENNIKHKGLILSLAEKDWLDKNEAVKYVYDPDWKPFEWTDDLGKHTGIISDLTKLIEEKSGINFVPISSKTWSQAIDKVLKKEASMFSGVGETEKKLKYLNFTKHKLYTTPYVLVSRQGENYLDGILNLSEKKVAVLNNSAIHGVLDEEEPSLKLIPIENVTQAFEDLEKKILDVFIVNATTAKYYINVMGYKKLKIAFKTKRNLDLKIAIRKDIPIELLTILDKTIKSISDKEISDILYKWTEVNIKKETDWLFIGQIVGVILLILIFVILNNRKLKSMVIVKTSEINMQKKELENLVQSFDKNVIASKTDINGYITYVSVAFCKICGYEKEELIGKNHSVLIHPDMPEKLYKDIGETIKSGKIWAGEIKNLKKKEGFYWIDAIISPIFDKNNTIMEYSILGPDITAKKEVEDFSKNLENKVKEKTKDLNKQLSIIKQSEKIQLKLLEEVQDTKKEVELILQNILLPVLITEQNSRKILYANKYAESQYEMPLDKIIGSYIDDIYSVDNQQEQIIELLKTKGRVENLEQNFKTSSGKIFTALLSVTPTTYKNEKAYIGMITDITKQKAIESEVREIHKHTQESIEYASLIQGALIPSNELFQNYFADYFTIWQPKDIVGGDIYLFEQLRHEDECLLMVIDCTGHGVPGAFVTMLVKAVEREIVSLILSDKNIEVSPAWVLEYFNKTIKILLNQETKSSISNAGWDGQIMYYNKKEKIAKFASARNSIFYIQEDEIKEIKGDRHSVGYKDSDIDFKFTEHCINLDKETIFYLSSDGYWDQLGGDKELSFGKKRVKKLLSSIHKKPMAEQKKDFADTIKEYQGDFETNDDITVIGLKI